MRLRGVKISRRVSDLTKGKHVIFKYQGYHHVDRIDEVYETTVLLTHSGSIIHQLSLRELLINHEGIEYPLKHSQWLMAGTSDKKEVDFTIITQNDVVYAKILPERMYTAEQVMVAYAKGREEGLGHQHPQSRDQLLALLL